MHKLIIAVKCVWSKWKHWIKNSAQFIKHCDSKFNRMHLKYSCYCNVFIFKSDTFLKMLNQWLFRWMEALSNLSISREYFELLCWLLNNVMPENNILHFGLFIGGLCVGRVDKSRCEGDFGNSWARHYKQRSLVCHSQWFQHVDTGHPECANGRSRPIHVPSKYIFYT